MNLYINVWEAEGKPYLLEGYAPLTLEEAVEDFRMYKPTHPTETYEYKHTVVIEGDSVKTINIEYISDDWEEEEARESFYEEREKYALQKFYNGAR